jgi:hypothetical protein
MEDKAKEYTEKQYYKVDDIDEFNGEPLAVYRAYKQCQEDMAKESIAFANFLKADFEMEDSGSSDDILWLLCGTRQTYTTDEIYDEFIKSRSFIKSLNKKDREEIQPNDIWNKESQDKIKEHILNLAKKQTPKDRLETELMAKKYTEEDMINIVNKSRETGLTAEYLILQLSEKERKEMSLNDAIEHLKQNPKESVKITLSENERNGISDFLRNYDEKAKKYTSEDYATKIMEVAYYGFPLVQRKETVHKIINALLIEYAEQK